MAQTPSINARMAGDFVPVHDPCIIKQGDTYFLFCTTGSSEREPGGFVPIRTSRDLVTWERSGFVFAQIPQWARDAVPGTQGIWAPDISFFNGRYHLYYSVSTFGSNHSVIGLTTTPTLDPTAPDYAWRDDGLVVRSRRRDRFNAIDPNLLIDRAGGHWLSWGSFWNGLKMARVDPTTGKLAEDEFHDIARRARPGAIEAPFIISHGDFYYLFASFEFCCRGADSTYFMACGRAREPLGPYLDVNGRSMMDGGGSIVVDPGERFRAFGHNAILREGERDFLVYHAYDLQNEGAPTLRVSPIFWTDDGWPRAAL